MKYFFIVLAFLFTKVWACPMCAGSSQNVKDTYTVYLLFAFIFVIYIPMYMIFKLIKKYKAGIPNQIDKV